MKTRLSLIIMSCFAVHDAMAHDNKAQSMEVRTEQVFSEDTNSAGQPIVFPQKNGHVTATIYTIPPGVTLPVHKHPLQRMGYVLAGTLRIVNRETNHIQTYGPGAFVLETVDQWHEGGNPGSEPLKLLVIDLAERGAQTTILRNADVGR
jgi:quercetin dioxygenase-like cupin family protein